MSGAVPALAAPVNDMTWSVPDWPPFFILQQGREPQALAELGRGSLDNLISGLAREMPERMHKFKVLNSRRFWRAIEAGEPICSVAAIRTPERSKLAYFAPLILLPPVHLIVRADEVEKFGTTRDGVALPLLLLKSDVVGLLEAGRSYGAGLDKVLDQATTTGLRRESMSRAGQSARLVAQGRVDFSIDYPGVAEYINQNDNLKAKLAALPIQGSSAWIESQAACPRTPWGLDTITAIDKAMRRVAADSTVRNAIVDWQPHGLKPEALQKTRSYLDERMKLDVILD
ncbi:TIGR02285 family protein [Roseateles koreensis]|uniref:TIGR02285 family protein n=1 Tax=Roseateles koreensis TaxID=2987526 RepID=A0ABT5KLA2_9BURK|nr:TIGR02285 family protein [Roseateles koreensis]MDC8783693.1 TIGR02285 family protein [Roseateles koreensis]